jgi:hypothetical protein
VNLSRSNKGIAKLFSERMNSATRTAATVSSPCEKNWKSFSKRAMNSAQSSSPGREGFQESVTIQQVGKGVVALPGIEPGFED